MLIASSSVTLFRDARSSNIESDRSPTLSEGAASKFLKELCGLPVLDSVLKVFIFLATSQFISLLANRGLVFGLSYITDCEQ